MYFATNIKYKLTARLDDIVQKKCNSNIRFSKKIANWTEKCPDDLQVSRDEKSFCLYCSLGQPQS